MKIKHKLRLGFGILFVVVIFFGALSLFYLNQIANSSRIILKDNYATLGFVREMRSVLDGNDLPLAPSPISRFNAALMKEEKNVTEKGEAEAVAKLKQSFKSLTSTPQAPEQRRQAESEVLKYLGEIERLNLDAVVHKSDHAERSIKNATLYLGLAGAFTFLVLFSFIFNLTAFFEEPLRRLADGINEISEGNYKRRLNFDGNDEFGEVSNAFNQMATGLDKIKNNNANKAIIEKIRTEAVIKHIPEPVIVLDENDHILFINPAVEAILHIDCRDVTGKDISRLSEIDCLIKEKGTSNNNNLRIKIGEEDYLVDIYEMLIPVSRIAFEEEDEPLIAGNAAGKVIILK